MGILSHLEPKSVFDYFERLCAVPHGSGNTKIISDLCVTMAKELGLRYRQEDCNNVIIWKDASPGYENAAPVILQGHMDMVCAQTEDCPKDMTREGLNLATDGRYVWAEKTSLGGDDCIAVAAAFAILADDSLSHPPLEVVITVDEETGMDGAVALDCSDLKGRRLLNLDSEEEGVFTVSCAGGLRADCFVPAVKAPLTDEVCFAVSIGGLKGGHSGAEIDKGRGSGNDLISRVQYSAMERLGTLRIADLRGGQFDNVICTRCDAVVAVPAGKAEDFAAFIREFDGILKNEYAATDGDVALTCAAADAAASRIFWARFSTFGSSTLLSMACRAYSPFGSLARLSIELNHTSSSAVRSSATGIRMWSSCRGCRSPVSWSLRMSMVWAPRCVANVDTGQVARIIRIVPLSTLSLKRRIGSPSGVVPRMTL